MTIVLHFRLFHGLNDNQAKALFWVGMYRLDRGNKEFEEDRRMFRAREKGFRLTGRTGFDQSLLALPALADWKLEAYRVRAASGPGCGIYHVHQGTKHAAIVRYSLPSAGIADYPRFHELNERLPFIRNQWTITERLHRHRPEGSGDRVRKEIAAAVARARKYLKLSPTATPGKVQQAIYDVVDAVLAGAKVSKSIKEDLAIEWRKGRPPRVSVAGLRLEGIFHRDPSQGAV